MANSRITKNALATALKELMRKKAFDKISVKEICEKCGMSRKSFYYHFKDKYDLIIWIFDSEMEQVLKEHPLEEDLWDAGSAIVSYLHANRDFYVKAMHISGQNSFSEHYRSELFNLMRSTMEHQIDENTNPEYLDFYVNFFADASVGALERWIEGKYHFTPEELVSLLRTIADVMQVKEQ